MKKLIVAFAGLGLGMVSCKKEQEPVIYEEPPKVETAAPIESCYLYTKGKDSIMANLKIDGQTVSGNLAYKFFEKDKSSGPISGTIKGDTIFADYTFEAEGTQSVREVVFLKTRNDLVEGYADMEERDGKMVFKDKKLLRFDSKTELLLIPCK